MKLTINLGDELSHPDAKIIWPEKFPIKDSNGNIIGEGSLDSVSDNSNIVEATLFSNSNSFEKFKNLLSLGVGGIVTSREKEVITDFTLLECSLITKNNGN